jgi:hypothetical protein
MAFVVVGAGADDEQPPMAKEHQRQVHRVIVPGDFLVL